MAQDVTVGIGFELNKSKIESLKASLQELRTMSAGMFSSVNSKAGLEQVQKDLLEVVALADTVEDAMTRAFNPALGTLNISTFQNELARTGVSIESIYNAFSKAGAAGKVAFQQMETTLLTSNRSLEHTHTLLDSAATTLKNSFKYTVAYGAINKVIQGLGDAINYVKDLDNSLNDIMIVTGKSADEMDRFAQSANKAAQELGRTTTDYTKASLTFYQQGLGDEEVKARTDLSLKVSNAAGLSAEDSAQYVTAVLNGYKVGSEEAEAAMDKLANVGAHTASSLAELSEAMSKTASSANALGVSEDQLVAMLATTTSVTRQNASSIGTAYKTILARISAIKAGTDEADVSLGEYTKKMAAMGFNVLDSTGHLRDLGDVIEEIGGQWANLTREQQISLAQTMAGTRFITYGAA